MINENQTTQSSDGSSATGYGQTVPNEMPISNDDIVDTLNGLIETCKDGKDGYKVAAEGIERSELKTVFYEFSQQRSEFVGVLQQLVRGLGGDPENSGSMTAAVHRGWIDIKSAVTGKNEESVLNECDRGEDFAKEAYAAAMKQSLPSNIADVVAQQGHAVMAAHDRIKSLRNAEAGKSATSSNQ